MQSVQFISVTQSCPTLCDPMNCSMRGLPVHHQLPEFTQTHVHRVSDAIQPPHPLPSPSPPAPNPSQHQSLFQWVNSSDEVAKVPKFQLQHHSLQRNPRADLLQNGLVGSFCRDTQNWVLKLEPGLPRWETWDRGVQSVRHEAQAVSTVLHLQSLGCKGSNFGGIGRNLCWGPTQPVRCHWGFRGREFAF